MKKTGLYLLFLLVVAVAGFGLAPVTNEFLLNAGILTEQVPVSGTGSMYPTFPKSEGVTDKEAGNQIVAQPEMKRFPAGVKILGKSFFTYSLKRGDIVEFENSQTDKITSEKYGGKSGFIKRVIGLPGDFIELRDGFVLLNNEIISEGYTAKPRSTYGGQFLQDCQKIKIPDSSVFVLGDNRKASLDSRFELGFVKINDIYHVIPIDKQEELKSKWRNTGEDQKFAHTSTLKPEDFVNKLNKIRINKKINQLKIDKKLNDSTNYRGKIILEKNDFSIEATKSGITLENSLYKAGYKNIIFSELIIRGYFEADELLENFFEFPDSSKYLLSDEFQDIGLSAVIGDVNNCPTQVIVIHLGGYKPPDYKKSEVESWNNLITNLTEILPSWKNLSASQNINQQTLTKLISILEERLNNAKIIYGKISRNLWLTQDENLLLVRDGILHNEAEKLINELNSN